jgi:hypothetical protein
VLADALALWTEILAIATFAVVAVGAVSLLISWKLARAAEQTADAAQKTAEASIRPLITAADPGRRVGRSEVELSFHSLGEPSTYKGLNGAVFVHEGGINDPALTLVSVPLKNVGVGAAVVSEASSPRIQPAGMTWEGNGAATAAIIGAGRLSRLQWVLGHHLPEDGFEVEVDYTDARGGQPMCTRLCVTREADSAWSVTGVAIYEGHGDGRLLQVRSGDWSEESEPHEQQLSSQ